MDAKPILLFKVPLRFGHKMPYLTYGAMEQIIRGNYDSSFTEEMANQWRGRGIRVNNKPESKLHDYHIVIMPLFDGSEIMACVLNPSSELDTKNILENLKQEVDKYIKSEENEKA